ncbi:sugar porter family MFS transporter [Reichenbachiella ulvae]|uniref:Sugar porter family MFS transporter n=1 Tax=Reichenbachiella ulvae TaxID=2980104 RepID=A0ABT3CNG0_9BACT|nr:sugar porter family MFS transporter [Reichenbachiella ulvae]MCV9385263.1 sugar porter family MFS transporter [Reichenbachiella ulvae]
MKVNYQGLWSFSAALAGLLFGFDTVVISGANLPIQMLWETSPWFHGFFIMSMALWGTVFGALFGGWPCQKYGRKNTLIWIGVLYTLSALGSAFAPDPYSFSFFRFIGGLGVGASTVACPMYVAEISTSANRGRLVALYQFNIVLGILLAYLSNFLLDGFDGVNDWRWMLGVEAIPALIYTFLVIPLPKSPRWLMVVKKDIKSAREVLLRFGDPNVEQTLSEMTLSDNVDNGTWKSVLTEYKKPMGLAFLIAFFNQFSGINFVLYFAPQIFEIAGLATSDSLSGSIYIGLVNLVFTVLGVYLIDRLGRRTLIVIGSIGYILSLGGIAISFYSQLSSVSLLLFIMMFIASHAVGQGAVIWVYIAEIFPNQLRSLGQSWGTGVHWVLAALITLVSPAVINAFSDMTWGIFSGFAIMMCFQLLFALFWMPETKSKSLEQIMEMMRVKS